MTEPMSDEWIAEIETREQAATKGPWCVWDGPEYVGGGADLCIATGDGTENWLANMDHRHNHYAGCHNCSDDGDTPADDPNRTIVPILSLSDEITKEQRATAEFIAHARQDVPGLLREVHRLKAAQAIPPDVQAAMERVEKHFRVMLSGEKKKSPYWCSTRLHEGRRIKDNATIARHFTSLYGKDGA